ncbi:hypothetical protein [Chryseobacterium sp. BIGb0232]|uniref:hypothetical protein n=1 Tax=Chryseobacterium sp. BIGb0232 TaxID=2940598 RepID=UPI000F491ABD|nr:hypothetical protein [Chryseobacterium sp. BIGb0232]MCS4302180.1 hypothetical protein [Chryseobacterium sp. BIGb0232]ROS18125.1 hypothetical protein EDF65_2516 [Chryseobacterium nakagawai]
MKLPENKFVRTIGSFTPVFKYIGIVFTWISLINETDAQTFLTVFEKKIGLEIFLLSVSFFLIGLGQNTKRKKDAADFKVYVVLFSLFTIGSVIAVGDNIQLLLSVLIIMVSNFVGFISRSGEYGVTANDIFISGRGAVFCFVLAVIYGIPVGLMLKHFNISGNTVILGAAVIGYYVILLFFEIRFLLKSR